LILVMVIINKEAIIMKLIKALTAIILAEITIAIPILVGIYVWSMVFFCIRRIDNVQILPNVQ
jgi:hypothetical protein